MFGEEAKIEETVEKYKEKLIVTLGSEGIIYFDVKQDRVIKLLPKQTNDVVNTVGAGDTFNGNFTSALISGKDFDKAIERGMYASAYKIRFSSAQEGMPNSEELDKYISKKKERMIND